MRRVRALPLLLVLATSSLAAQDAPLPDRAIEVWGGVASDSPRWGLLGASPGMNLGLLAVRFTRTLGAPVVATTEQAFEFHVDLIPLVLLSRPYVSAAGTGLPCPRSDLCVLPQPDPKGALFPSGSAVGFGFNPAGLTVRFRPARTVAPSVGVTAGALYFDRAVPTNRARRFNFTAQAEVGVRIGAPDRPGVTLKYRFHHLSNAGTSRENPGVASHLATIGFQYHRRASTP